MSNEIYKFRVGEFDCISFKDEGAQQPIEKFFPDISAETLQSAMKTAGYENPADLSYNCVLIDTGDQRVLIDSGNGVETDGDGRLFGHLEAENISRDSIDVVVLTHAHADHYAGLLTAKGEKNFPNARYVMWRDEWAHYTSEEVLKKDAERGEERIKFIEQYFLPLKDKLVFVDAQNTSITPNIQAIYAPGHTRHHIAVEVESNGETLIIAGDALAHPLQFNYTDWHWAFEDNPENLQQSRHMLIQHAIDKNALFHAYHFAFPGIGRLRKDSDRNQWSPLD